MGHTGARLHRVQCALWANTSSKAPIGGKSSLKAVYHGKENKNGHKPRIYRGTLDRNSILLSFRCVHCCALWPTMITLQLLDILNIEKGPVSRYNVYMRSSTSPLFTLPSRFSLVCAIMEVLLCIISPTPKATFSLTFRRGTFAASLAAHSSKSGFGPTISTMSIWCLQSTFCKGLVGTFSPPNNHLSPLALEDSPSMTFI